MIFAQLWNYIVGVQTPIRWMSILSIHPCLRATGRFRRHWIRVCFKGWEPLRPQARAAHIQQHHLGIANYAAHYAYNMV